MKNIAAIRNVVKSTEKPRKHNRRPASGDNHPAPFESALWPHVELIKKLRLGRKTWVSIAAILQKQHGVSVKPVTIYNFLKRYAKRARAGTLPLGFEPITPPSSQPSEIEPTSTTKLSPSQIDKDIKKEAAEKQKRLKIF